jgi:hypothetical protein
MWRLQRFMVIHQVKLQIFGGKGERPATDFT